MQGRIILDRDDEDVAWIRIDNPARRNAVSLAMWQQLGEIVDHIDSSVRCVVVRGEGDLAFVAGADISEFGASRREADAVAHYDAVADAAMAKLANLPQPTIAMISGYCIGGGMALALSCDIRLASASAQFAIPAARLGLGYGVVHVQRLVSAIGSAHAMDMIASARRLDAAQGLAMGLVNSVHDGDTFADHIAKYVRQVRSNAPLTIQAVKHAICALRDHAESERLAQSQALANACFASDDYAEGVRAFAEKRQPVFAGK